MLSCTILSPETIPEMFIAVDFLFTLISAPKKALEWNNRCVINRADVSFSCCDLDMRMMINEVFAEAVETIASFFGMSTDFPSPGRV